MARNDWVTFNVHAEDLANKVHNMGSDTFMVGLINNDATLPAVDTLTPRWADFSANEVSGGTSYVANGKALTGTSIAESGGVVTFDDTGNVLWAEDASGPEDIYWAILYNITATNDEAVGFLDMGGPVSLKAGDVSITWHASGIWTLTVTA